MSVIIVYVVPVLAAVAIYEWTRHTNRGRRLRDRLGRTREWAFLVACVAVFEATRIPYVSAWRGALLTTGAVILAGYAHRTWHRADDDPVRKGTA